MKRTSYGYDCFVNATVIKNLNNSTIQKNDTKGYFIKKMFVMCIHSIFTEWMIQ